MAKKDYYEVLGIGRSADEKEIKCAYRKLAKKYHPDTNPGDKQAEQKFKEITEAYDVLGNPEKKKMYDQYGFAGLSDEFGGTQNASGGQSYSSGGFGNGGTWQEFRFTNGSAEDVFGDIFGKFFHGHAGAGFGRSRSRGGNDFGGDDFRQKGTDARAELEISFDEAVFGCNKTLQLRQENGSTSSLQVHIPAGIDEGQCVRLKGKGTPGYGGGEAGDLMLEIHIRKKMGYERKGNDVYVTVNIPFTTAVFGGEAIVPTLTGKVSCRIAPGTQSGSKIRLKNKGIPSMKNPALKGDEYIVVQIEVPKDLSPEEKRKLMEYDKARKRHGHKGSAA